MAIFDALAGSQGVNTAGWSALGSALGGGQAVQQNAYQQGVLRGAQSANLLEEARKRRNANVASNALQEADFNAPDQRNAIIANQLMAGQNPNELSQALGHYQENDLRGNLIAKAMQPGVDMASLNPGLAVFNGKPVETTRIEGNTVINPYVDPDAQAGVGGNIPTAIGQADIGLKGAQATNAYASAGEHNAQATHALQTIGKIETDSLGHAVSVNPGTGKSIPIIDSDGNPISMALKGTGGASGLKASPLSPTTATQIFGAPGIKGDANPEYQQFEAWRAQMGDDDPRYLNGDFAAQQWQLRKQNTASAINDAVNASLVGRATGKVSAPSLNVAPNTDGGSSDIASALAANPQGGGSAGAATSQPSNQSKSFSNDAPAQPKSKEEFDSLPSGTPFINPSDGKLMRKK